MEQKTALASSDNQRTSCTEEPSNRQNQNKTKEKLDRRKQGRRNSKEEVKEDTKERMGRPKVGRREGGREQRENMEERERKGESQGLERTGYACKYVLARQAGQEKHHQWSITQSAIHQNEPTPPKMGPAWLYRHPE